MERFGPNLIPMDTRDPPEVVKRCKGNVQPPVIGAIPTTIGLYGTRPIDRGYCQLKLFGGALAVLYHLSVIDSWSRPQQNPSKKREDSSQLDSTLVFMPKLLTLERCAGCSTTPFEGMRCRSASVLTTILFTDSTNGKPTFV